MTAWSNNANFNFFEDDENSSQNKCVTHDESIIQNDEIKPVSGDSLNSSLNNGSNSESYNAQIIVSNLDHINTNSSSFDRSILNSHSSQNQTKRQREWVYLCHYLTIEGLDPVHIISGQDDGCEPDFTLVFWENEQLIYIGIELTTLPRLRTQMIEKGLIAKRWYWQSLHIMAKQNLAQNFSFDQRGYRIAERFKIPLKTLYMPKNQWLKKKHGLKFSKITQHDVNAVMKKKKRKVASYHTRRELNQLWLLIHTDKYQPNSVLTFDKHSTTGQDAMLTHDSKFDRVHITCYPSYQVLNVRSIY